MSAARRTRRPPRFYFSLRSPYSWLAYRDLLEHHPRTAAALEWVPFFEPDELSAKMLAEAGGAFPYTPMSAEKHRYILQDVRRLAAARGLSFSWPVDRDPVWEVPHLGYLAAARHGRGPEYIALAARARWELGQDVCDRRTIAGFGAELGLDAEELAGASDDPELRAEGCGCCWTSSVTVCSASPSSSTTTTSTGESTGSPPSSPRSRRTIPGSRRTPASPLPSTAPKSASTTGTRADAAEPPSGPPHHPPRPPYVTPPPVVRTAAVDMRGTLYTAPKATYRCRIVRPGWLKSRPQLCERGPTGRRG